MFKKKRRMGYCSHLCPSIRLLSYLLNHWTKFNQIWCVSYSHECGVKRQVFFTLGHGEGSKGQIFNFNYKVNFKTKLLCVFSQMKDTKHIGLDFHSVAWVMPQGGGRLGYPAGQKSFLCPRHDNGRGIKCYPCPTSAL